MRTITSKFSMGLASGMVAAAMVFSLALAPSAHAALTSGQIQSILDLLVAFGANQSTLVNVEAALKGQLAPGGGAGVTSRVCPYTWTRNLTTGSTGADAMKLQQFLNDNGFTVAASGAGSLGNETSFFGPLTRSAVIEFQNFYAADILAPVSLWAGTGFVGPSTHAKLNALCTNAPSTPDTGDGTGDTDDTDGGDAPLKGGAGSIQDADYVSSLSGEEVGEDQKDVGILGLDLDAASGSDIELVAVSLNFSQSTGATGDFEDYAEDVSVRFEGRELARVDATAFNDRNNYDATISLDRGAVIRAGERDKQLIVAVSGLANIDSNDLGDRWTLEVESVRFRDATGAVISDNATGIINDGLGRAFSFEKFATAQNVELTLASGDERINNARAVEIHSTNKTRDVELFSFTMEAEGNSDLEVRDLGIDAVVTGASHIDDVIAGGSTPAIELWIDGTRYGTASYNEDSDGVGVGQDEEIAFTDVDFTIPAGKTVNVTIRADILATNDDISAGDTLQLSVGEAQTDNTTLWNVRDESNEQLADADITGAPTSGAHGFFTVGINLAFVSSNTQTIIDETGNDDDSGTFTLVFDATSFGGTVYVGSTATATTTSDANVGSGAETDAIIYRVYDSGVATTDDLTDLVTFTRPTGVRQMSGTGNIEIQEDRTTRITLTVTQTNDSPEDDGIYFMDLAGVGFSADDDTTYEFMYKFDLDEFETGTVFLN